MKAEQLAIHSLSTSHRTLEEALDAYAAGFQNVEPYPLVKAWMEDGHTMEQTREPFDSYGLRFIASSELAVECFHASDVLLPNLRANAENARIIGELGGSTMIVHTDGPEQATAGSLDPIARALVDLAEATEDLGVDIAVEFNASPVVKSLQSAVRVAEIADHSRVGVIFGGMGTRHAETLTLRVPGARVAGVTDLDRSRAEKLAASCGRDVMVFENEQALIRDDSIDVVVITTPDETHAGLVMECLEHEKPVFYEKPLAITVEDARRIVDAEVELGRKVVQLQFMRRYDPQHLDVKNVIDSGAIGHPVLFKETHRNAVALPGTNSESILVNSAVHDLDAARWLLGQEIEEVYVHGTNTPAASDDELLDLQVIQLKLSGGCLASIEVYVNAGYGYEVDLEVVGDAGTVHIAPANAPVLRKQGYAGHPVERDWLERFPAAYVLEMQR